MKKRADLYTDKSALYRTMKALNFLFRSFVNIINILSIADEDEIM